MSKHHQRAVLMAAALVLAALVAVLAVELDVSQSKARRDVRVRFGERAKLSAALTQSLFSSLSDSGSGTIVRRYGAAHVSDATMSKAARTSELVALVLLAPDGSRLASSRGTPPDVARAIKAKPLYIRQVLAGRPFALSNVQLRGRRADLIVYVQPIVTRHGRRLIVSGFETRLMSKFFGGLLARVPLPEGGRAYLLDATGVIIGTPAGRLQPGRRVNEPGLTAALRDRRSGGLPHGRYFAASAVEGSPWRVVLVARTNRLYASLGGAGEWLPWMLLAGFGMLAAVALVLVGRISRGAEALDQANTRLRGVFDASPIGIVLADEDLHFHHANDAFCRLTGFSADELRSTTLTELIHPDNRPRVRELMAQLLRGEIPSFRVEKRYISKSEETFWAATTITVLRDDQGNLLHVLGLVEDVSEHRRAQQELAIARDEAVEASRVKSALMANVSHEIRTPMNGVIGMNDLLLDSPLDPQQREYAEAIRSSGDALMTVIEDILDFSKIEAGKVELHTETFQLREVVEQVVTMLSPSAGGKELEVIAHVDPAMPDVLRGDANRIRQVLSNFMTNAVKFTHAGEVVVSVTGQESGAGAMSVRFEVRDTGIGIDPGSIERVFDAFSQADSSTTRRYGGTGLGLAISKQLVELMGGEIGAQSTPGKGSTFWFTLPLEVRQGGDVVDDPDDFSGVRALVVDDNATSRATLAQRLSAWGMSCDTAPDGEEALRLLRAAASEGGAYELALLDVDLAAAITADESIGSLALVMLAKPVRESRLREEIQRALAPEPAEVPSGPAQPEEPQHSRSAGRHVLVAEDNAINQLVAVRMLEQRGCRVMVAANGREALELLEREHFDAVFMDCQMPELDGYETTAEIRRREGAGHHTPIIAMTANTNHGDREKCLAAGMDDYVGKPLRAASLDAAIARVVAQPWLRGGPLAQPPEEPSENGAGAPVLDRALLDEMFQGDEDGRRRLIALFLEHSQASISELADAVAAGDLAAVQRIAHGLKGSAAGIGALSMAATAGRLCEAVTHDRPGDAPQLHAHLEHSFAMVASSLSQEHARARA